MVKEAALNDIAQWWFSIIKSEAKTRALKKFLNLDKNLIIEGKLPLWELWQIKVKIDGKLYELSKDLKSEYYRLERLEIFKIIENILGKEKKV